jgi:hypothetical protein
VPTLLALLVAFAARRAVPEALALASAAAALSAVHATYLLLALLLAAAAAVLAVEVATHLVDFKLLGFRVRRLDAQYEWSWSHLASTAMFGAGACACAVGAVARRERRAVWLGTSAAFAFLCVDGATRLHDGLSLWPVLYVPVLGGIAAGVLVLSAGTPLAGVARAGLLVLGASLVVHVVGHEAVRAVGWGPETWGYQLKVAFKEGLELAGWALLVPTLVRLAVGRLGDRTAPTRGYPATRTSTSAAG